MTKVKFYNKEKDTSGFSDYLPDEAIIEFAHARYTPTGGLEIMVCPNYWMVVEEYTSCDDIDGIEKGGFCFTVGQDPRHCCYYLKFKILEDKNAE